MNELRKIPGVEGIHYYHTHNAGVDVVYVLLTDRDPDYFPKVVKDQTVGSIILELLKD
jgi:hypothetical protein